MPVTARQTVERNTGPDVYAAPVGVFANDTVPTLTVEGAVRRAAWRIDSPGLTPFQVMRPLREQLTEAGFDIVLDCHAVACGGFDFRFATETLPGPNMYVNIRAYHMVTGVRTDGGDVTEVLTILASTSSTSAYVQIIHAGGDPDREVDVVASAEVPLSQSEPPGSLTETLLTRGSIVLDGLEFATGRSELSAGPYASLKALADFMQAQPRLRVALVGHTDTVGSLEGNITISRQRARSVRQRLIDTYGVDPDRLDAEGMGYLAPVASNLDPQGRELNRRVEAVVLSPDD